MILCFYFFLFSKIIPSFFTIKEGSTSHPLPSLLRSEGGNRPTRCSGPLRSKVGGPSKVSSDCAGWYRLDAGLSIPNLKPYLHESAKRKD